jgi:AraC family transcriptional regulator of adaptative response / DNA-3-methyladenine glycosylase II
LAPHADPQTIEAALLALPGIGPWTASYVLMRALHWPNAFPAQDVVLQNALGTRGSPQAARLTEQWACVWQPWRSYAVMCLWQGMTPAHNASNFEANNLIK